MLKKRLWIAFSTTAPRCCWKSPAKRLSQMRKMGDLVMVDSTTENFGRIAAQTAKQVLLQRVREAEREHFFEDFSGREGELVNGTVQSISGQHITIGLGRTEAILPKSQQVARERYRAHDKIRVYVLEVRRTSRGPQIVVSRNHRNLLRRLSGAGSSGNLQWPG